MMGQGSTKRTLFPLAGNNLGIKNEMPLRCVNIAGAGVVLPVNIEIIRLLLRGKMNFRQKFLWAALIYLVVLVITCLSVLAFLACRTALAVSDFVVSCPSAVIR